MATTTPAKPATTAVLLTLRLRMFWVLLSGVRLAAVLGGCTKRSSSDAGEVSCRVRARGGNIARPFSRLHPKRLRSL